MKTIYTIFLLLPLFFNFCANAQMNLEIINKEKHQILSLEHDWLSAELRLDTAFIASLLDPGFIGISEYGVHTRQEELEDMYNAMTQRRKNNIRIDTFEMYNGVVNLYANTAVVTFIMITNRNENGVATQRRTRFYDVWVKKDDRWFAVSSQGVTVKE